MLPSSKASSSRCRSLDSGPQPRIGFGLPPAWICAALLASGCAAKQLPYDEAIKDRRRPDAVVIDPVTGTPRPDYRAEAADGMVVLRTPLGVDQAMATVAELFRKATLEDVDGIESVFSPRAQQNLPPSAGAQPSQAGTFWQQRLRKLRGRYALLAGETLYREGEVEIFRAEDAAFAPRPPAIGAESLDPNDFVMRVPILIPRVGPDRLFGDEVTIWLKRDGSRFRIHQVIEDFQLN